jgi:hypothetical protein
VLLELLEGGFARLVVLKGDFFGSPNGEASDKLV